MIRKLNRATLDPRIIGESLHYLDNQVESNVLVCFIHGTGWDHSQFESHLQLAPYRALAPTLYGFELETPRRIPLSLDDHTRIVREFMRDAIARLRPAVSILVGCSSGGDVGFVLLGLDDAESPVRLDGFLSLGCNLSLETCFVTRLFARMTGEDSRDIVRDLQSLGATAQTLGDWLNVHEYLVRSLRKFRRDIAPVRRLASDIVAPFETEGEHVFAEWYRTASARVGCLRCVFEESDSNMKALRDIRLRNLDEGILGENFREDSIVTVPNVDHFDLLQAERVLRYVDEMVGSIRGA
ncbi:MAG: alpha/beta fold hydrolase [Chloroflexota bacterium]